MADETSPEQLREYEKQLADVMELLEASPDDESLLSLKADLEELVALTRDTLGAACAPLSSKVDSSEQELLADDTAAVYLAAASAGAAATVKTAANFDFELSHEAAVPTTSEAAASEPPNKKQKKIKDFEVPPHLVPLDTDSEAEKNKKRRAVKALKSKWREQKKAVESEKKQKSWQSFQSKKKLNEKSIFSTHSDAAKVGVTSSRHKTEFAGRQKHKH